MMPGTVYQYQPGLMGQYIPNMPTQVIQTPMPYMQPPAYRSPAPIPPPQQLLQKREKKPLPIFDPSTKTVVQVSTPPPTVPAAATAAVVNPPVPPGGHPVPGPYTMPLPNISQPFEQELSSSNSVEERFRLQVQDLLTRPQTTSPADTDLTAETVATMEPLGGPPMMDIAEEFKAKVHST